MSTDERRISSLRDLPRDVAPTRDLWKEIEAAITADAPVQKVSPWRANRLRIFAAAAVVAALAIGVWIGRSAFPGAPVMLAASNPGEPEMLRAAYIPDARYTRDRAELVKTLESKLAALPPESRTKVVASLKTIEDSKRDLETALGRDPTNALLQELLVNTYQDEMRVLTAVHEAGDSGRGI
ncbi:MAG TPA: hypothetical protein VMT29_18030 [Steroidobacteraceae bacterium]|nr:hypothetical protein [Steroidobacteraceae bacterium]